MELFQVIFRREMEFLNIHFMDHSFNEDPFYQLL